MEPQPSGCGLDQSGVGEGRAMLTCAWRASDRGGRAQVDELDGRGADEAPRQTYETSVGAEVVGRTIMLNATAHFLKHHRKN
jgi:hypothetical protein